MNNGPRFGGKAPRYGGKQPRRPIESDDEKDDESDDFEAGNALSDDEVDDDEDWGGKKKGKKAAGNKKKGKAAANKKTGGKKKKRVDSASEEDDDDDDDDFDEEEAPPQSRRREKGNASAAAAAPGGEFSDDEDDVFDAEKLYLGSADRESLASMTEMEREQILAERHELRVKDLAKKKTIEGLRLKKAAAEQSKKGADKAGAGGKKQATTVRGKAAARGTSSEQAKVEARQKSIEDMRRRKKKAVGTASDEEDEEDEDEEEEEEEAEAEADSEDDSEGLSDDEDVSSNRFVKKRAAANTTAGNDDDDEEGSGYEQARQDRHRDTAAGEDEEEDAGEHGGRSSSQYEEWPDEEHGGVRVEDVNKIRIPRRFLEEKLEEPYLEKCVKGCFVRFLIGAHNGEAVYRMCEVRGVEASSKPYRLPGANKGAASVLLRVRHGAHENSIRIDKVSNQRLSSTEVAKWVTAMRDTRQPTLTRQECQRRHDRLKDMSTNHVYNASEIQAMVAMRGKAAITSGKQNLAQVRLRLSHELESATDRLSHELESATEACSAKLAKLQRLQAAQQKDQETMQAANDSDDDDGNGGQPQVDVRALSFAMSNRAGLMEQAQVEASGAEAKVAGLEQDLLQVGEHQRLRVTAYAEADKLGNVNARNRVTNVRVDGEDSRTTLQEEFLGTGHKDNVAFRRIRTAMTDLWATKDTAEAIKAVNEAQVAPPTEEDEATKDVFSKVFGGNGNLSSSSGPGSGGGSSAASSGTKANFKGASTTNFARSKTGLKRRLNEELPRKRRGISLQAYLEQAQAQQAAAAEVTAPPPSSVEEKKTAQ
eukprot:CAMPEP_0171897276 /NCGR_PEP_ID=MMETSP0992-20121227/48049_1 /TAXON_ID=483369 /ORGANISM="non described non described, Strain CCMP2098" /LENGTH=819 /DNA_ID=CAMNT_0012525393 /DNA_START=15 /DNA_END=2474 /DNA_ORIENTATION=+